MFLRPRSLLTIKWYSALKHLLGAACSIAFLAGAPSALQAADHIDSPSVRGPEESLLDITDLFVFKSPNNPERITLIMGLFSPEGRGTATPLYDPNGSYQFFIDTDGDEDAEHRLRFTYDEETNSFLAEDVPGALESSFTAAVTPNGEDPIVARNGAVKVFAGLADDPFVLDFEAFQNFLAEPCLPVNGLRCAGDGSPSNFFNGLNVAVIAVEFPATSLNQIDSPDSGALRVWSKTFVR